MAANTSWPKSLLRSLPLNDKPSVHNQTAQQVCMKIQVFWVLMTIHLNEKCEVLTANKHTSEVILPFWWTIWLQCIYTAVSSLEPFSGEPWQKICIGLIRHVWVGGATASCPSHPSFTTAIFKEVFPQEFLYSFPAQDQNLSPKVRVAGNKLCKIPWETVASKRSSCYSRGQRFIY